MSFLVGVWSFSKFLTFIIISPCMCDLLDCFVCVEFVCMCMHMTV